MILDATAGKRMMWFNKQHANTIYLDKKRDVKPSIVADHTALPFKDSVFDLVLFDPPHSSVGTTGKGELFKTFGSMTAGKFVPTIYRASRELFRVLKKGCFLIFKWNTHAYSLKRVLAIFPYKPLFGQKTAYKTKHSSSTYWLCFQKL